MQLRVTLAGYGDERDRESLIDWLRRERMPSVTVGMAWTKIPIGQMGSISDALLITVTPVAIPALVRTLIVWLRTRRTDVRLTVRSPKREVTLDVKRLKDPEDIIRTILSDVEAE